MSKVVTKRPVGRPTVFKGQLAVKITSLIRKNGLTKTRAILAEGVEIRGVTKKINISLPTLAKLARKADIQLERGRPALQAA